MARNPLPIHNKSHGVFVNLEFIWFSGEKKANSEMKNMVLCEPFSVLCVCVYFDVDSGNSD